MPLPNKAKIVINSVLNPIGFKLSTTIVDRTETARLEAVDARRHWESPRYDAGLQFEPERYLKFLREVVAPYRENCLAFPTEEDEANGGYFLQNHYFGGIDAEVLYAIVRHHKPGTIVEVGSGYSTRIMTGAIRDGKLPVRVVSIDPSPRADIDKCVDETFRSPVECLSHAQIAGRLDSGDILFIDSSHLVATGGDVTFLFLEVLPRLKPGVMVHIHDIFLPYDYPRFWIKDERRAWTEQYLVHAFLCHNRAFEIVWPSHFMWREHQDELLEVMPRGATWALPASLWIRKIS